MTQPAAPKIEWDRVGDHTFGFSDRGNGIELKLRNTRHDDGQVKADLYAFHKGGKVLVRPAVNLTGDRSLPSLIKSLQGRYEAYDWSSLLELVCSVLTEQMAAHGIVTELEEPFGDAVKTRMLFEGFMPEGLVSGLMAHGGGGKSLAVSMMMIAVATGKVVGPFKPLRTGRCLYLDWENNERLHAARIKRICMGLGVPFPEKGSIIHYEARAKLGSAENELIELAHERDVVFTGLDSIGYAAGGNLNESDVATASTMVLKHLPGTKLMVAHVSKSTLSENGGAGKMGPTGSAFFWNGPQAVYELRTTDPALDRSIILSIYNPKANVGPRMLRPLGIHVLFDDQDDNSGPITPTAVTIRGDAPGGEAMALSMRILDHLLRVSKQVTAVQIAHGLYDNPTKSDSGSVERTLRGLREQGKVHSFERAPVKWALAVEAGLPPAPAPTEEPEFRCHRCPDAATAYTDTGQPACEVHSL